MAGPSTTSLERQRPAPLEDLVCFDLYAASRALTALYRPMLGALGLTYPQYLVLTLLRDLGPQPVRRLADDLHLDHGTLTPLLRRLERADLLTRTRSTQDERVVLIELTSAGAALGDRFEDVRCQVAERLDIGEVDMRALQQRLRAIADSADPVVDGSPPDEPLP